MKCLRYNNPLQKNYPRFQCLFLLNKLICLFNVLPLQRKRKIYNDVYIKFFFLSTTFRLEGMLRSLHAYQFASSEFFLFLKVVHFSIFLIAFKCIKKNNVLKRANTRFRQHSLFYFSSIIV